MSIGCGDMYVITHTPHSIWAWCVYAVDGTGAEEGLHQGKKMTTHPPCRRRENSAGRNVPGRGEAKTLPKMGKAQLATMSPTEVRPKKLRVDVHDLMVSGVRGFIGIGGGGWFRRMSGVADQKIQKQCACTLDKVL
jgi:hypothetical protein